MLVFRGISNEQSVSNELPKAGCLFILVVDDFSGYYDMYICSQVKTPYQHK